MPICRVEFTGKGESLILGRPISKRRQRRRNGGHGVGNTDILLRFLRLLSAFSVSNKSPQAHPPPSAILGFTGALAGFA